MSCSHHRVGVYHSCGALSTAMWNFTLYGPMISFTNGDNGRQSSILLLCDPNVKSQIMPPIGEPVRMHHAINLDLQC